MLAPTMSDGKAGTRASGTWRPTRLLITFWLTSGLNCPPIPTLIRLTRRRPPRRFIPSWGTRQAKDQDPRTRDRDQAKTQGKTPAAVARYETAKGTRGRL